MITIRRAADRGHVDHGWLDARHSFSFGSYHDPDQMGFRDLRVINEDRIAAGRGFGTHPHRDMEIVTYPVSGALEHRDSMGNGAVLRAGEAQRMTAGRGITHSEFNHSAEETLHLLQIWILPAEKGTEPGWEQKEFPDADKRNVLRPIVAPDGRDGAMTIGQDAVMYASVLDAGRELAHDIPPGRHAWLQVIRGRLELDGHALGPGDGAAIGDERTLRMVAGEETELLLFDLN